MPILRLGTRKSALAQAQAKEVAAAIHRFHPDIRVELVPMTTSGDKFAQATPSPSPLPVGERNSLKTSSPPLGGEDKGEVVRGGINLKALFTKELEEALLDKRVDLAVHSLKDMSVTLPEGLVLAAVTEREDPRDCLISLTGTSFMSLRSGSRIGTNSLRRRTQIWHARPDLEIIPIRGNVDSRLRKLREGICDALVLALAGLKRLGMTPHNVEILPYEIMLPAVGQGSLGIETRDSDEEILRWIQDLNHETSATAAQAERAFLRTIGGGCQVPLGAYARLEKERLRLDVVLASVDGQQALRDFDQGDPTEAEAIGKRLADKVLAAGGRQILQESRASSTE